MTKRKPQPKWRNVPDEVILRMTPTTHGSTESLCPTPSTVYRAISGDPTAREVINAWAFRAPVTVKEVLPCA